MIRTIDIRLNAAHPELPLPEATTYQGAPSTAFLRGVPKSCGLWQITAVNVAATFPDNSTTTRAAVLSAGDVWVVTIPACATSGRTVSGLRILADGTDENGDEVTGYVLGVADLAVATFDIAPAPGVTSYALRYFDNAPNSPHKGDVAKIGGALKYYDGTAWQPFADMPDVPSPSTDTPLADGTASAGSSDAYARGDHRHPTDTSRAQAGAVGGRDVRYTESGHTWHWAVVGAAGGAVEDAWFIFIDDPNGRREIVPYAKGATIDRSDDYYGYKFVIDASGSINAYYYLDSPGAPIGEPSHVDYDSDTSTPGFGAVVAEALAPTGMDSAPTAGSTNPVSSGGVKTALDGKLSTGGGTVTGELTIGPNPNHSAKFESDPSGAVTLLLRDSIGNALYISGGKLYYRRYDWQTGVELFFPSTNGTLALAADLPSSETWTFEVDDGQGGTTTVTKNVAVYAAGGNA